jgi:hypothetical protein
VFLAFWFAPMLVQWARMSALQALFYSFFAGWRNWRAFLVYGAVLVVSSAVLMTVLSLFAVAMHGRAENLPLMVMFFVLFWLPTLFGSFYASYRDVFPEDRFASAPGSAADAG